MTRIRLVGVDDDLGRGGRVLSVKLDLIHENEDATAEVSPQSGVQFKQLLEDACHCGVRVLNDWGFSEKAELLRDSRYSFTLDDPWFRGTLEQDSYGVSLAAGFVLAALGIEEGSPEVVATGVLDVNTLNVTSVDESQLDEKAIACLEAGASLLCPPDQFTKNGDSYSLPRPGTLQSAVLIVGGVPLMEALLRGGPDSEAAESLWNAFCESHIGARLFPHNLPALQTRFTELLKDIDMDLRASVIARVLSLGTCASLSSEFENLLQCMAACKPHDPDFEASLAERVRTVFNHGVNTASGELLSAVAWLFMGVRWVFGGERLVDRLSPVGMFFRELLDRAQTGESGRAEQFVLQALTNYGLRSEGLNRTGNVANDIVNMVAEEPSGSVVAIYKESEQESRNEFSSNLRLDRLAYEIDTDLPFQLFDYDRAEAQVSRGVIKIGIQDYDIKILWRDGLGIFPPSIDTLHFIGDLATAFQGERAEKVTSVVDIGYGTGVLGLIAAKNFPQVNQVHFIDIEPGVREILSANILANWPSSAINIPDLPKSYPENLAGKADESSHQEAPLFPGNIVEVKQNGRTIRLVFHNASADAVLPRIAKELPDGKFSVAIATPPYLPIREPLPVPIWPAAAGTGLLKWAVSSAGSFAGEMYLSYGEIAQQYFDSALRSAKQRWDVTQSLLGRRVVRFRFPDLEDLFDDDYWGPRLLEGPLSRVGDMRIRKESHEQDMNRRQDWLDRYAPEQFRKTFYNGGHTLPPFVHVIRNCHLTYS
jgi:Lysine methyltransferase